MRMVSMIQSLLVAAVVMSVSAAAAELSPVYVNGERLPVHTLSRLEQAYRTEIPAGRYWYDRYSGLWGLEGGPGIGQIMPNLALGGPLRADASGGGTHVFVNGREIHPQELAWLQRLYGQVMPGRYWLDAHGVGGYEGGPPRFDLRSRSAASGGGYNRNTPGGSLMSDGNCSGYLHPGGSTVMTGDC